MMRMFEAYFDETGSHDHAPVLSLAGFMFAEGRAAELRERWAETLAPHGIDVIHMVEWEGRAGPYRGLDPVTHRRLHFRLVELIGETADCGVALALNKGAFDDAHLDLSIFRTPYTFLCHIALCCMSERMGETGRPMLGTIHFEQGPRRTAGHAGAVMRGLLPASGPVSCQFVPKEHGGPIQAADMFAWLHNKNVTNLMHGKNIPRKEILELERSIPLHAVCLTSPEHIYALLVRLGFPKPPLLDPL